MRKWITCTIMAVMMAAMIFMGTGNKEYQSQVCQSEAWNLSLYPIQREGDNKR